MGLAARHLAAGVGLVHLGRSLDSDDYTFGAGADGDSALCCVYCGDRFLLPAIVSATWWSLAGVGDDGRTSRWIVVAVPDNAGWQIRESDQLFAATLGR